MTRSKPGNLHPFNPEIDRTYHRLHRQNKNNNHSSSVIVDLAFESADSDLHYDSSSVISDNSASILEIEFPNMANHQHERTLKELATPDVIYQPLCIQVPDGGQTNYELKSGLIHLLPKFHGLAGEDPHKHLKEFHVVCSTMRPNDAPEEFVKMKAFPFSLSGAAKDWLYFQPAPITIWNDMKRRFLEKFFPASRTAAIRKEISGIRQIHGENLYEYWERFNKLCSTCPNHQINEQLLIQYFYEGLMPMERSMIDAASGGALMDKTPHAARNLISNMAENSQQFSFRNSSNTRAANEVSVSMVADNQRLENKLTELTSLAR